MVNGDNDRSGTILVGLKGQVVEATKTDDWGAVKLKWSAMAHRLSLLLSFLLSSLLLLPFLSQATSSGPSRVGPFRHLESFGSFNHLEGSKKGDKREGIQKVKQYLQRYGYISSTHYSQMGSDDFNDALESSLKAFQTFYHLNSTGTLDAATATLMSRPRCGFPDHPPNSNRTTNPNYAFIMGIKWPRDQMHIHYIVFPGSHLSNQLQTVSTHGLLFPSSPSKGFERNHVLNSELRLPNVMALEEPWLPPKHH